MSLLGELQKAEALAIKASGRSCDFCTVIKATEDEETREVLESGTIGAKTLSGILAHHGTPVDNRVILRHRNERHEP